MNLLVRLCAAAAAADALEAFLPTLGEGVREVYAVSARDPSFLAGLATEGKTFSELLSALLLPTAELFSFVDFMYAGNLYRPSDQLVLATFNQVRAFTWWRMAT